MSTRRRWPWVLAVVITGAALAVYAVDRASVALIGAGPLDIFRPSTENVLDGRVGNAGRLEAIEVVNAQLGLARPGATTEVGRQGDSWCVEGQNNWKVHDGYRLRCGVTGRLYSGWSGDFESVRTAARQSLGTSCAGPDYPRTTWVPEPGAPTTMEDYNCTGGVTISLVFASTASLSSSDSLVDQGGDSASGRHISGMSGAEVIESAARYQWLAVAVISKVYYQDEP